MQNELEVPSLSWEDIKNILGEKSSKIKRAFSDARSHCKSDPETREKYGFNTITV